MAPIARRRALQGRLLMPEPYNLVELKRGRQLEGRQPKPNDVLAVTTPVAAAAGRAGRPDAPAGRRYS